MTPSIRVWFIVFAAGGVLVGCREPYKVHPVILACEQALLNRLKAPSTYKREYIDHKIFRPTLPADEQGHSVVFFYWAKNPFGVELRGRALCTYDGDGAQANAFNVVLEQVQ